MILSEKQNLAGKKVCSARELQSELTRMIQFQSRQRNWSNPNVADFYTWCGRNEKKKKNDRKSTLIDIKFES